jgi:hypothetical protein
MEKNHVIDLNSGIIYLRMYNIRSYVVHIFFAGPAQSF